jgi:GNAT superfamily N-acetyltransferase
MMVLIMLRLPVSSTELQSFGGDEVGALTELFARCFAEELWCARLVEVLPSPDERHAWLLGSCRTDLEAFAAWGGAFVLGGTGSGTGVADDSDTGVGEAGAPVPVGLALVGSRAKPTRDELGALGKRAFEEGCQTLSPQSRKRLAARLKLMEDFSNGHWMDRFCAGDFRYLYAICVDRAQRRTGVFSRLIDPVIAECDELGIPLFLECYTERLVSLYGSKGFEVLKTLSSPTLALTEYCMMRAPRVLYG